MTAAPALALRGLTKRFGPVLAVDDVSLSLDPGTITGLVGENGAGKSTLMNIAYGLVRPDRGAILVGGREARTGDPRDAIRLGIGMVHQHFKLVEPFTVLENVLLGAEDAALLGPALRRGRAALARIAAETGLAVDPDARAGDLPVGEAQKVEILKALYRGAAILILDEPTAVLTPAETDRLFVAMRTLAGRGAAIVLVTHKLREVFALTDRIVVMRAGRAVAERATAETSPGEIASLMIGRDLPPGPPRPAREPGPVRLRAEELGLRDAASGRALLDGIDVTLRAGEIVGVAGVAGNGQSELLEVLAGMRAPSAGRIAIGDRIVAPDSPADADDIRRLGVAHVPEHRHRHGIVPAFAAAESAILGRQADEALGRTLLSPAAIARRCAALMRRFDVRPLAPALRSDRFSGGNGQKLVMAREVAAEPVVLLCGQPTRGVDIGAIAQIQAELAALRDRGCAILLVSAELDEILALADTIVVMNGGRITGTLPRREADARRIGLLMAGGAEAAAA